MRRTSIMVVIGILILVAVVWGGLLTNIRKKSCDFAPDFSKGPVSIFDYDDAVFAAYGCPLVEDHSPWYLADDLPVYYRNSGVMTINPGVTGASIIVNLLDYNRNGRVDAAQLERCISPMEQLREIFDANGKFPRTAYQDYADGWVSSMDAPTVMVASRMLYEITEDEKWHEFVKALSTYVVRDIQGGGFNFCLDEEAVWPLEYAEKDISYDKAYFVLNGSLYGYVGMFIVAEVEKDEQLKNYLEHVGKGYEKLLPLFPYKNYTWTNYMLHPATICQPHYVFFEWALLKSAARLTNNPLFQKEFAYRTTCLKSVLKPQFKMMDGKTLFIVHRACSPHPYMVDCYPSQIIFYDADGKDIGEFIQGSSRWDDGSIQYVEFLYGEVPQGAVRYAYVRADLGYETFSGNIGESEDFVDQSDAMRICKYTLGVANDAQVLDNGDVHIANELSSKEEGTLIYQLHEIEAVDTKCLYGMEIENLTGTDLDCGLTIRGGSSAVGRYYTPLKTGKNLVLFNILGFRNLDTTKLNDIRRIDVRLYTNTKAVDGTIRTGRLLRFKDLFDLREYRMTSEYEIPAVKRKG